jgi:hypothetical protein
MTKKDVMARWKRKTSQKQRPLVFDCIIAEEIVYNVYKAGFIKWKFFNLAIERIERTMKRAMNGAWMFEKSYKDNIDKINEVYINSLQKID